MKVKKIPILFSTVLIFLFIRSFNFVSSNNDYTSDDKYQSDSNHKLVLCKNIVNHEPVNPDSVFSKADSIFLFLKPDNGEQSKSISINWYYENDIILSNSKILTNAPYYYWRLSNAHKKKGFWSVHVLVDDSLYIGGLNFYIKAENSKL